MKVSVFPLAGGAYFTDAKLAEAKTHACEVNEDGFAIRVLCGRAKLDSICNDLCVIEEGEPTCKGCQAKLRKLRKEGKVA